MSLPVAIEHADVWHAYKRWCAFCETHYGGTQVEVAALFETFLGLPYGTIEWQALVFWFQPHIAAKIHILNGPHHFAMCKVWAINHNETSMEVTD